MIGLMFFGAIALWGLVAIGVGLGLSKLFKESWRGLAAFALIPLVFFAPVADEIIALPQMNDLCADLKPYDFAPGMDEKKAFGRAVYHKSVMVQEMLWPPTVKVTRMSSTYVDATTTEPILIQSWLEPSHGMLGMPNGSSGGKMPILLKKCSPTAQYDSDGRPLQFKPLNLTLVRH